ncbi:hypothetical protein [Cellulomonas shaoxiangyii]|uniref:Uncharacterized protein n=1 Tax=Cellulomonas shaoxiangyii TaxID=2566013 RepID=A0A4P7SFJ6_9CELL|nr:hypothetical protein [Cellulomonas shaoxiangyii]QCB92277.1 hypothetical protein E5225_00600 [Cellulomonas shaoxiangyii]TGY85911.1 hypothetical protein E5226_04335 [Cellulomonas shaoxiangyii]
MAGGRSPYAGTAVAGTARAGTAVAGTAVAGTAVAGTVVAGTVVAGTVVAGTAVAGTVVPCGAVAGRAPGVAAPVGGASRPPTRGATGSLVDFLVTPGSSPSVAVAGGDDAAVCL